MIQGSSEWFAARCGMVTASRIADIMAKTKTGPSASRANYLAQIVAERLTGVVQESYSNAAMTWGTETEPLARMAYELRTDSLVETVGFIPHPTIKMAGASPDGLAGDGLIEIKCPNTSTHIDTLLDGTVPGKYVLQMQWQMACTGRSWCDFVSYDPRMPEHLSMFIKRVERDDKHIGEITESVIAFLVDVETTLQKLSEL
jgi:putative phage-type endonuclease